MSPAGRAPFSHSSAPMSRTALDADLELAIAAAREAGRVIMRTFGSDPEVRHKSPDQPVTDADLAADALLADRLRAARPGYGWLSEETIDRPERLARDRVWIVDPIDGTRSFIAGYPDFAVSIGLAESGAALLGVVHNPARDELFWAIRGGGAHRVRGGESGTGATERLRIGDPATGARPMLLASRSEIGRGELDELGREHEILELGSTAYKLAALAAGSGDGVLSRGPKSEWDVAAAALLVQEAGGVVTDVDGAPLRYNRPDPYIRGLVAAGPALHAALLDRVRGMPMPRLRGGGRGRGPEVARDERGRRSREG